MTDDGMLLDRLAMAHSRGLLVPFIGAGMSAGTRSGPPGCPLWPAFVANLERIAETSPRARAGTTQWAQRVARAVRNLRHRTPDALPEAIRKALTEEALEVTAQSLALARVEWPLVLTTNYDDLYLAAANEHRHATIPVLRLLDAEVTAAPLDLLGRSPADCQRVLASLRRPAAPILWALQGFVGGQAASLDIRDMAFQAKARRLEDELVVGHAEYRRVTAAAEHFRRAFAEVFRSRSLLFLGSGLADPYLLDLFGEVVEYYGASPMEHFAVMKKGSSDPEFLRHNLGITVHEIDDHGQLADWLNALAERVASPPASVKVWTYRVGAEPAPVGDLRVEYGALPTEVGDREGIALSAGGHRRQPEVSGVGDAIMAAHGLTHDQQVRVELEKRSLFISRFGDQPIFTVNARMHPFTREGALRCPSDVREKPLNPTAEKRKNVGGRRRRDLRLIAPAVEDLIEAAHRAGLCRIHAMLLAAGGLRAFPRSFSLQEMARGYAQWVRHLPPGSVAPSLTIYVTSQDAIIDLRGGRLDIDEIVALEDARVWIEIVGRTGGITRFPRWLPPTETVRAVLADIDIADASWSIDIAPRPSLNWHPWTLADVEIWESFARTRRHPDIQLNVDRLGVVPGSTIRVSRQQ